MKATRPKMRTWSAHIVTFCAKIDLFYAAKIYDSDESEDEVFVFLITPYYNPSTSLAASAEKQRKARERKFITAFKAGINKHVRLLVTGCD